jgi:pyruvate,water dikinase
MDTTDIIIDSKTKSENPIIPINDDFWQWRFHMAELIAAKLELDYFGVNGIYLFGSVNTGTAGPGSDIDLLIHFRGTGQQQKELSKWLEGWSLCLAEINYFKTGYTSNGLLDVHFITDENIAQKTAFAIKIGSITDPAYPLKTKYQ